MIKINKQLSRPDGGVVASGSIVKSNTDFDGDELIVKYRIKHYITVAAMDAGKETIPAVTNFGYYLNRQCTAQEWADLFTEAGAGNQVELWLQTIIDELIGVGNTEII